MKYKKVGYDYFSYILFSSLLFPLNELMYILNGVLSLKFRSLEVPLSIQNIPVQGTVSLKLLGGKLAPKLGYFVLRKELLNFSETVPRSKFTGLKS